VPAHTDFFGMRTLKGLTLLGLISYLFLCHIVLVSDSGLSAIASKSVAFHGLPRLRYHMIRRPCAKRTGRAQHVDGCIQAHDQHSFEKWSVITIRAGRDPREATKCIIGTPQPDYPPLVSAMLDRGLQTDQVSISQQILRNRTDQARTEVPHYLLVEENPIDFGIYSSDEEYDPRGHPDRSGRSAANSSYPHGTDYGALSQEISDEDSPAGFQDYGSDEDIIISEGNYSADSDDGVNSSGDGSSQQGLRVTWTYDEMYCAVLSQLRRRCDGVPPPVNSDHYPFLPRPHGYMSSVEESISLASLHSAAFLQAQSAARLSEYIGFFKNTPWHAKLPVLRPWHLYGFNVSGSPAHGRLSPFLYLCDGESDYGLCAATFGTLERCHLGLRCRWKHEIKWADLKILITSGRLCLVRARAMIANWQCSEKPEMRTNAEARMMDITVRLAPLGNAQILTHTYPYVTVPGDAHTLFERFRT
jgi:hypothetical protein